jgi:hypothetical protein
VYAIAAVLMEMVSAMNWFTVPYTCTALASCTVARAAVLMRMPCAEGCVCNCCCADGDGVFYDLVHCTLHPHCTVLLC